MEKDNGAMSFTEGAIYETNLSNAILIEKLKKENKELVEVLESVKEAIDNGDILDSHRILETLNKVKPKAI